MKVKIGEDEVVLEPKHLEVSEVGLNDFLKTFAGIYSYYNTVWAKAQYINYCAEDNADLKYSERFQFYKENEAGSDKLVDAKAKMHPDVIQAKQQARNSKYAMQLLYMYLKALDKAHDNALNLGYNVRKEMDKLFPQSIAGLDHDVVEKVAKLISETAN